VAAAWRMCESSVSRAFSLSGEMGEGRRGETMARKLACRVESAFWKLVGKGVVGLLGERGWWKEDIRSARVRWRRKPCHRQYPVH